MSETKCEPPSPDWGRPGWYWVYKLGAKKKLICAYWRHEEIAELQDDDGKSIIDSLWSIDGTDYTQWTAHSEGYRYLSPALTPAEADALRAERDAMEQQMLSEHQAAVDQYRIADALRAEVGRLREALEGVCKGIDTFHINPENGANICVEGSDRFAHERDVRRLLAEARAALTPEAER